MHDTYITLAGLNAQLAVCSVNAAQLQALGFEPVDVSTLNKDTFTPEQWRSYRTAKLYERAKLNEIRAAIAEPLLATAI